MTRTEHDFRFFPEGGREPYATGDLTALQAAGHVRAFRGSDGLVRITFAKPFDDLVIVEGERLSLEKRARFLSAQSFFDIVDVPSVHP